MSTSRRPRLWVIDPSLRHAEDEGVAEILHTWPGDTRVFRPALAPGDGPGPGAGYATDGVVLMGSRASVHDDHPWLRELAAWLLPILDGGARVPCLGICFGHQLFAQLAGGRVDWVHPDRRKIVGVRVSRVTGSRLMPDRRLRVVVSHREEVRAAPPGYRVVASRRGTAIDGLEHESRPVFSFQFHPEARGDFARHAGIDPARIDAAVRADSRVVLGGFRRLVLEPAAYERASARP